VHLRTSGLLAAAVVTSLVAAPAAAQREKGESPQEVKSQEKSTVVVECPDPEGNIDQIVFEGDLKLWPPNHKYQDLSVTAVADDPDENVMLTTTVTHDEYVEEFMPTSPDDEEPEEEVGAGNTRDDARPFFAMDMGDGEAGTTHEVRAERSGRGDGRTYTVTADASFDGNECSTEFLVEVPHDMRSHKAPAAKDRTGSTGPNQD
jgi:hypothetical protein